MINLIKSLITLSIITLIKVTTISIVYIGEVS
jgi:hypothetical protein